MHWVSSTQTGHEEEIVGGGVFSKQRLLFHEDSDQWRSALTYLRCHHENHFMELSRHWRWLASFQFEGESTAPYSRFSSLSRNQNKKASLRIPKATVRPEIFICGWATGTQWKFMYILERCTTGWTSQVCNFFLLRFYSMIQIYSSNGVSLPFMLVQMIVLGMNNGEPYLTRSNTVMNHVYVWAL